jgi:hypothetical protein
VAAHVHRVVASAVIEPDIAYHDYSGQRHGRADWVYGALPIVCLG